MAIRQVQHNLHWSSTELLKCWGFLKIAKYFDKFHAKIHFHLKHINIILPENWWACICARTWIFFHFDNNFLLITQIFFFSNILPNISKVFLWMAIWKWNKALKICLNFSTCSFTVSHFSSISNEIHFFQCHTHPFDSTTPVQEYFMLWRFILSRLGIKTASIGPLAMLRVCLSDRMDWKPEKWWWSEKKWVKLGAIIGGVWIWGYSIRMIWVRTFANISLSD